MSVSSELAEVNFTVFGNNNSSGTTSTNFLWRELTEEVIKRMADR